MLGGRGPLLKYLGSDASEIYRVSHGENSSSILEKFGEPLKIGVVAPPVVEEVKPKVWTVYTDEDVSTHNKANDLWVIVDGAVYDVTKFAPTHPG